jgi:CSLREA domain-containing protein
MKTTLATLVLLLPFVGSAPADTFVVNNVFDPGNGTCDAIGCTLREAIDAANANPGADIINFNIPGTGVHTITPATSLPEITDTTSIDGYTQPGSSENTLAVGDDAVLLIELDGSALVGVGHSGIRINSDENVIRGLVINRFSSVGISLGNSILAPVSSNNLVEGNFIGTDPSGTSPLGNTVAGVGIFADTGNLIGGATPAARNLISGNGSGVLVWGVTIDTSSNTIAGNYIGTDHTGTAALPNGIGVNLYLDTFGNTVGGLETGTGNLISGNDVDGIGMGFVSSNTVLGNFIGVDGTGAVPLKNGDNGIEINNADDNVVGGTTAAARNIIAANETGVLITGGATGNTVQGNYIGTDVTGFVDVGSDDLEGVKIDDSPDNLIGGSVPGAGNLISGNFDNIEISSAGSTGNLIQGNLIGTDATGAAGLDFFGTGILLSGGSGTTIGGPAGSGNVIAFNGGNGGVAVASASTGNNIFGNLIFGNEGIGINLIGGTEDPTTGVTANDFPDSDAGANNLQNYPVISQIAVDGAARSVEGSLTSNPNTDYVLDFYSNADVDASGYGEGETWLGSLDVHTNAQSTVEFSFSLDSSSLGRYITATATDPNGNTSEFSLASEIVPPLSRFLNISTRLRVQTGDNVLIGGFIIDGNDPKEVIVRAIGPSLGDFGVSAPLANPILELHYPDGTTVVTNNNWRDTQEAEVMATGLAPNDDLESAIVATLEPGAYTAIVRGVNDGTGVALVETYDLNQAVDSSLANISTRGLVETGDNVMIGGIIVGPDAAPSGSILLRAIGPSLSDFGITNPLADPMLELHDINGVLIVANDDWKSTQQAAIEATGLPPNDDKESAILATLAAGNYTAIMRGVGDTTGIGLVEAYHLD